MKDARKLARKEFPRYGAVLTSDHRGVQVWAMPWGARLTLDSHSQLRFVRETVEKLKIECDPIADFQPADAPQIQNAAGSSHFAERLEQMRDQAGLTLDEVRLACLEPTETRYCERTGSYAYLHGRVAVVAAQWRGGMRLITLLWTRPDLWVQNPRPEKGSSYA